MERDLRGLRSRRAGLSLPVVLEVTREFAGVTEIRARGVRVPLASNAALHTLTDISKDNRPPNR